jgi:hypothetical protein
MVSIKDYGSLGRAFKTIKRKFEQVGTVRLIAEHLKKIGVNASYGTSKNGEFIENSFIIK